MSPYIVIAIIAAYFAIIFAVSYFSARKSSTSDFFRGGNSSPWWVVAIGMIGTTLSGVTFISVPGMVAGAAKMTYFEVILGNFLGYILIMHFLLPLYYRLNLTSIYGYIQQRIGHTSYKTSAVLFLISKLIGAGFRLFIVALVLQITVFEPLDSHLPSMPSYPYSSYGHIPSKVASNLLCGPTSYKPFSSSLQSYSPFLLFKKS